MDYNQLKTELESYADVIYNADWERLKQWGNSLLDDELRAITNHLSFDDDARWDFGLVYLNQIPGRLKKIQGNEHPTINEIRSVLNRYETIHTLLQELKPKIIKGKKPTLNRKTKPRTLENTGTCAVCGQNVKLDGGLIVHHGFVVRGQRIGSCFGVGYQPWEVSPKGAEDYLESLKSQLQGLESYSQKLESGEVGELYYRNQKITPEDGMWGVALSSAIATTNSELRMLQCEIQQFTKKIETWQPQTLPH